MVLLDGWGNLIASQSRSVLKRGRWSGYAQKSLRVLFRFFFGCKIMNCFCLRPPYLLQNAGTDALIVFVDYLDTMHRNTTDLYNAQMGLGVGREAAILHLPQALPILFADSFVNAGSRGTFHWRWRNHLPGMARLQKGRSCTSLQQVRVFDDPPGWLQKQPGVPASDLRNRSWAKVALIATCAMSLDQVCGCLRKTREHWAEKDMLLMCLHLILLSHVRKWWGRKLSHSSGGPPLIPADSSHQLRIRRRWSRWCHCLHLNLLLAETIFSVLNK